MMLSLCHQENYLNFLNKVDKSLDGQELKSCMQEEIKKYLGSLLPESSKMNYVNNINSMMNTVHL